MNDENSIDHDGKEVCCLQACTCKEHAGLTFKCPRRRPDSNCIMCLGCESDSYEIKGKGESGYNYECCGSFLYYQYEDGSYSKHFRPSQKMYDELPGISINVANLVWELARYKTKFKALQNILHE